MNTATNVSTGKPKVTGGVWRAPKGTAVPTDATTALSSAYKCLGYVSEDGVENTNDMSVSTIKAWGGLVVYRSLEDMNDEFGFGLIESLNPDVLKAVYGEDNVTIDASGNIDVAVKAQDPEEGVWIFELALRGGVARRIVVENGAIVGREAITYNDSDPIKYGITLAAYPGADGSSHHEYTAAVASI